MLRILLTLGLACTMGLAQDGFGDAARVAIKPRAVEKIKAGMASAIRLDVRLVLVPVTVTDGLGAPFAGLSSAAFHIFEDGAEQVLKYFANDDAPVSLGVVFDSSNSMEGKLDESRAAVTRLFRESMPGDEFFLVEFNDLPRLLCKFTTHPDEIETALTNIRPNNWTALLDAVYLAVQTMRHGRHQRKALLILSDGGDNNSRYSEAEIRTLVREADVCIYSIALVGGGLGRHHVRLLRRLAEETGGQVWEVEKMPELPGVVAKVNAAIRNQYLLGYSSSNRINDGMYRKIEVRVAQPPDQPRLRVSWRTGYYAPAGH